jgi:hypothetical protein
MDERPAADLAEIRREAQRGLMELFFLQVIGSAVVVVAMISDSLLGTIVVYIVAGLLWLGWAGAIFLLAELIKAG